MLCERSELCSYARGPGRFRTSNVDVASPRTTEDLVKEMAKEEDQISKATAFGEGGQMVRKRVTSGSTKQR